MFSFFQKVWTPTSAAHQMTIKVLGVAVHGGADNNKERIIGGDYVWIVQINFSFIYLGLSYLHEGKRLMM
jgi:ABC-type branched-subunit amino acid transport system permease subunit